uniref:Acyl-coenzyme A thioesterase 1-like n=1 Tax=Paramormyrops kingsleyae TaxID=1676925 RepID=A0A3B3SUL0_9TELE
MEARPRRGRGDSNRRRGGDGGVEKVMPGEYRGRGRGSHRGRERRDQHRGRGRRVPEAEPKIQDDANNLEDVEDEAAAVFSKRKLESNWSRYEAAEESERSEEQPTQRGADYHALLASAGDSYTQFQFAEEKDWELDSLANNQMSILFMDVQAVAQSLQLLPLCHKLNLEPELVQVTMPSELPIMPLKVRQEARMTEQLKTAGTAHRGFARGLASPTVAVPGSHKIQGLPPNGTSAPASEPEVADEELDFLLSLQHPATNMKNSEADSKQTADVPGTYSVMQILTACSGACAQILALSISSIANISPLTSE